MRWIHSFWQVARKTQAAPSPCDIDDSAEPAGAVENVDDYYFDAL